MKRALITGISGQDGSYLAEYLLQLGYEVYGLVRREPQSMRWLEPIRDQIELLYGDMRDATSLEVAFRKAWPDEVYNLAGQVFVPTSWECPSETFDINVGGLARLLKIIAEQKPETRIYQASSSEMFGNADEVCTEHTPMNPTSPYGASKMAAHRLLAVYRGRGLFAVGGILFNHESPRRGPEMVTRKITLAAARWMHGDRTKLKLGNLEARRDWGFAGDYVGAMHAMLQRPEPKDYVIGTGKSHSIAEFIAQVLAELNGCNGNAESGRIEDYVEVDPRLFRTGEIHDLRADASVARMELGWKPGVDFPGLVRLMVQADLAAFGRHLRSTRAATAAAAPHQL
ncbi:MAG: GDP-mannose 4,6-dehydratase [Acidobacteria bacterium]|nr:MAG: GDP-mannose 4,6-dehydratase [Acidobacteriota bacterium]